MAIVLFLLWVNVLANKKATPRIAAAITISQLLKQQGSLSSLLPQQVIPFTARDTSFIKELCYGCCRWHPLLECLLDQLLKTPIKEKDTDIKAILLLGLYQLQFLRTAGHAAVNESVNAVGFFKKHWAKKLVNGVLRQYQRNQEKLFSQALAQQTHSHPQWLHDAITSAWPMQAEAIFAANNQHPPLTLRVNLQHCAVNDYIATLADAGLDATLTHHSPQGINLRKAQAVERLPLFNEGAISVQDEAAQLAAHLLQLEPGLRVLDACCAPGGKTCHIGELQPQLSALVAVDVEQRRLHKVRENLKRLSINADILCGDATQPQQWWDGKPFDRILLDAPCSASGIIRRQPDIKLLRRPEDVHKLASLQRRLLNALWPLLTEGGILLYVTCSILPQENISVIEQFAEEQAGVIHQPIQANWGVEQAYGRQLFPTKNSHDGFFYAKLKKQFT